MAELRCQRCNTPLPAGGDGALCLVCVLQPIVPADSPTPAEPTIKLRDPAAPPAGRWLTQTQESDVPAEAAGGERVGKYLKATRLGAGGMGEVWKAWDVELRRWVALKFLKRDDPEELARFRREAQMAAKLSHPNIASVYEAGDDFIAMQWVDGVTLHRAPKDDPRLLAEILRQAAVGVAYAHEQGIVHRDLKPANIMVSGLGKRPSTRRTPSAAAAAPPIQVFVMDFGLAKSLTVDSSLSLSGAVLGTPAYMSPEQAQGARDLDHRTDVYSLGATFYELLTHRPPFTAPEAYALLKKVVEQDPTPVRKLIPGTDRDLETIAMKCLEKDRARRYPTAGELAEDLSRWLAGEAIEARRASRAYRLLRWMRRNRRLVAVAAAGLILCAALTAWFVARELAWKKYAQHVRDQEARLLLESARRYLNFGDRKAAERTLREMMRNYPDSPDLGEAYWMLADVVENPQESTGAGALPVLEGLAARFKGKAEEARAHTRMGRICERMGFLGRAEAEFRSALDSSRLPDADRGEIGTELALASLLARQEQVWSERVISWLCADVDGTGIPALLLANPGGLDVLRAKAGKLEAFAHWDAPKVPGLGGGYIGIVHPHGRPLILYYKGSQERAESSLYFLEVQGGGLVERGRRPMPETILENPIPAIDADLGGKGAPETVIGLSYYRGRRAEIWNWSECVPEATSVFFAGSDVYHLSPDGSDIFLYAGPWKGYEARLYRPNSGRLELLSRLLVGLAQGVTKIAPGRWLLTRTHALPNPDYFGDGAPCYGSQGLVLVERRGDRLCVAAEEDPPPTSPPDGAPVVISVNGEKLACYMAGTPKGWVVRVCRFDSGGKIAPWKNIRWDPSAVRLGAADLYGDGHPRLFAFGEKGFYVFGMGSAAPGPGGEGSGSAEALVSVGDYGQAADRFEELAAHEKDVVKRRGSMEKWASCLDKLGRIEDALRILEESGDAPLLESAQKMAVAHSMWSRARAIAEARSRSSADPRLADERKWISEMDSLPPAAVSDFSFDWPSAWRLAHPLGARRHRGEEGMQLTIRSNEKRLAWIPFEWDGGPLAIDITAQPLFVESNVYLKFELHREGDPDTSVPGSDLGTNWGCWGGEGGRATFDADAAGTFPAEDWLAIALRLHRSRIEYVPALREVRVTAFARDGTRAGPLIRRLDRPLAGGRWQLVIHSSFRTDRSEQSLARLKLERVEFFGPGIRPVEAAESPFDAAVRAFVSGRFPEAIAGFENAPEGKRWAALARYRLQGSADALVNLLKSEADPVPALRMLAGTDDPDLLRALLAVEKKAMVDLCMERAENLYAVRRDDDAYEMASLVENPDGSLLAGKAAFRRGNFARASHHFDACEKGRPEAFDHLLYLARIAKARGDLEEARNLLRTAVKRKLDPMRLKAHAALRDILPADELDRLIR